MLYIITAKLRLRYITVMSDAIRTSNDQLDLDCNCELHRLDSLVKLC